MTFPSSPTTQRSPNPRGHVWWPAAACAALFLAGAMPLILSEHLVGRGGYDQFNFHLPAIRTFAQELPRPDVGRYPSATTPGYHLVLSLVARWVSDSPRVLQLAASAFTIGLLATLAVCVTRRAGPAIGLAVCLPVVCSVYFFSAGVWLLPDNAGWWGMLGVLLLALRGGGGWLWAGAGVLLLVLVAVRQNHLWTAATLWTAAWLGPAPETRFSSLLRDVPGRVRRLAPAFLWTLPAFGAVAAFALLWGGLTPPMFHEQYAAGIGGSAPAIILSLFAVFSCFFAAYFGRAAVGLLLRRPGLYAAAAFLGLVLVAVPDTTFSIDRGRFSGVWNLVRVLPVIGGRTSVLLLVLAPIGAAMIVAWASALRFRERWIMLAAMLAYATAQSVNIQVWQRYMEPFVLIACALMASMIAQHDEEARSPLSAGERRGRLVGPLVLAAAGALLTMLTIRAASPAEDLHLDPKADRLPTTPVGPPRR